MIQLRVVGIYFRTAVQYFPGMTVKDVLDSAVKDSGGSFFYTSTNDTKPSISSFTYKHPTKGKTYSLDELSVNVPDGFTVLQYTLDNPYFDLRNRPSFAEQPVTDGQILRFRLIVVKNP
jgi:hypothetical protein